MKKLYKKTIKSFVRLTNKVAKDEAKEKHPKGLMAANMLRVLNMTLTTIERQKARSNKSVLQED